MPNEDTRVISTFLFFPENPMHADETRVIFAAAVTFLKFMRATGERRTGLCEQLQELGHLGVPDFFDRVVDLTDVSKPFRVKGDQIMQIDRADMEMALAQVLG